MKIDPLALNPDVGFVHSPTVVGRSEPRAQTSFHFWGIPLDPTPHRDVIGVQTSLGEQLLDVPVRQGKTQIPRTSDSLCATSALPRPLCPTSSMRCPTTSARLQQKQTAPNHAICPMKTNPPNERSILT